MAVYFMTPNQVVAYNLRRARERRGWTQEEAAERLEPYLGEHWSKASYSAAERTFESEERIRQFSPDDLYAFARAFELPIGFFLAPPPIEVHSFNTGKREEISIAPPKAREMTNREQAFELIFGLEEDAQDVLVGDVLEFSGVTTQALNRWRDGWISAAEKRQRRVDELFGAREDGEETS